MIRKHNLRAAALSIALGVMLGLAQNTGYAAQASQSHGVTINVPKINQIIASRDSFSLSFEDYIEGSLTNEEVVSYQVRANNVQRDQGVIQVAARTSSVEGVELQADPGAYSKVGGNATLVESVSGFTTVQGDSTGLFNKQTDESNGMVLRGEFPITYRAVALRDLAAQSTRVEVMISVVEI